MNSETGTDLITSHDGTTLHHEIISLGSHHHLQIETSSVTTAMNKVTSPPDVQTLIIGYHHQLIDHRL